jgi:hypothetical protein
MNAMKASTITALLFLTATVHCGGSSPGGHDPGSASTDDPSSMSAADGGAAASSPAAAFAGQYQATWSSTATITSPEGIPPQSYTDTATIDVTAIDDGDIGMAWQVGANAPSGTITFAVQGTSAAATALGTGGTCWMGTLTNGNQQTTCATSATAAIVGDQLSQRQTGTIAGTTPEGVAYTGTYEGIWTGTRTAQ